MTIPFRPPAPKNDIPIIGQPFKVKGGFPTVLLQCTCDAKEPVMLIGGQPGACAACGRMFVVASFAFDRQSGQIQVNVGLMQGQMPEPIGSTS